MWVIQFFQYFYFSEPFFLFLFATKYNLLNCWYYSFFHVHCLPHARVTFTYYLANLPFLEAFIDITKTPFHEHIILHFNCTGYFLKYADHIFGFMKVMRSSPFLKIDLLGAYIPWSYCKPDTNLIRTGMASVFGFVLLMFIHWTLIIRWYSEEV